MPLTTNDEKVLRALIDELRDFASNTPEVLGVDGVVNMLACVTKSVVNKLGVQPVDVLRPWLILTLNTEREQYDQARAAGKDDASVVIK